MARTLDPAEIQEMLHRLRACIREAFEGSRLSKLSGELVEVTAATEARTRTLQRPYWALRVGVFGLITAGVLTQIAVARHVRVESIAADVPILVGALEAAVNLLILFGAGVWFLLTLEQRLKRVRALAALHELRSFAHVVDMHQLTKDPALLVEASTAESPRHEMTTRELARYLDYCAEMLAIIGKLAALYAERTRDGVVISAVNDIESLTSDLARKVWQKTTILGQLAASGSSASG